jgi:alpha-galactosidase
MSTETALDTVNFSDVLLQEQPEPLITYRSGMVVYEESLTAGALVGRGWNGAGLVNFYDGRIPPGNDELSHAFRLEIDGQLLASDWEWGGAEVRREDQPVPAMGQPFNHHVIVTLRHHIRSVSVRVHTGLDGTAILTRWLEVTNTGEQVAAIGAAATWSGRLQNTARWRERLKPGTALYSVGTMANPHWGNEGDFRWVDLPDAGYVVEGRYPRDRFGHPFFVLRNNATGEHFIGQLAWSGGYQFRFDLDAPPATSDGAAALSFRAGLHGPAPQRTLEPGETVRTPEMHLGLTFGDLDTAIQAMHQHIRQTVFMPQPRGRGGWIECGIGPELEITEDQVWHAIDCAAELGAEVFFIDASWYTKPRGNWWSTVGNWQVDRQRFPKGLEPFRERVKTRGMLWGLWMDAERIGTESGVYKDHPEWLMRNATGQEIGGMLDLTSPDAAQWMEGQIAQVIETNQLDFFRLDYNTHGCGRSERNGFVENHYWRYYDALYAVYDRLRARFPAVIFESCASGGGRTDLGMVRRFSHTWVTDWQIAPRSFMITNGMTMALPPESVDRLIGGQSGHTAAELDFQWRLLLFVRPTLAFLKPMGADWNPLLLARLRHWLSLYKDFVRPFQGAGRIYHHTPVAPGPEPRGWGVLELASEDRIRAICGLFQLGDPEQPEHLLRFRGLDAGRRYRVTFDNRGQTCELDGFTLMHRGITVRLEGALTSELLICRETRLRDHASVKET